MSLFRFENYREVLASKISENKRQKGCKALLATAMGVHSSHVSHVLTGTNHLNSEQGAALCEFWKLDANEADYFLTLIENDRASTSALRDRLRNRLEEIRHRRTALPRLPVDFGPISVEASLRFFSKWYLPVIHSALSIPSHRTIKSLAVNLHLSEDLVESSLKWLEEKHMVKHENDQWHPVAFGLTTDSREFQALYHQEIRKRASEDLAQGPSDSTHYTMLCAIPPDLYVEFRSELAKLTKTMEQNAMAAEKRELIAVCVDLFKITRE